MDSDHDVPVGDATAQVDGALAFHGLDRVRDDADEGLSDLFGNRANPWNRLVMPPYLEPGHLVGQPDDPQREIELLVDIDVVAQIGAVESSGPSEIPNDSGHPLRVVHDMARVILHPSRIFFISNCLAQTEDTE